MSLPLQKHESFIQEGIGADTAIMTITSAGLYRAFATSTYGSTQTGVVGAGTGSTGSGVTVTASTTIVTIAQAGSATVSVSTPAALVAQSHSEVNVLLACAVGDTITFTVATTDPTNSVKTLFNVVQVGSSI